MSHSHRVASCPWQFLRDSTWPLTTASWVPSPWGSRTDPPRCASRKTKTGSCIFGLMNQPDFYVRIDQIQYLDGPLLLEVSSRSSLSLMDWFRSANLFDDRLLSYFEPLLPKELVRSSPTGRNLVDFSLILSPILCKILCCISEQTEGSSILYNAMGPSMAHPIILMHHVMTRVVSLVPVCC